MKKTILIAIIAVLLLSWATAILAQDNQNNKTPIIHGPFYFLKTWGQQIKSFFTFGKAGQQPSIKPVVDDKRAEVCAQVITWAVNPAGKICKQYPTPCKVPKNWKIVDKCPPAKAVPKCDFGQFVQKNCPDKKRIYNCVCNKDGKWDCPSPETACPKLLDVKYQDCPDGKTKVVSCESYQEGAWQCSVSPELKCPLMHKPPVTNGAKCKKAGEIKYYKCPKDKNKKIPWCACGPEGGWKGAKNKWQCIRFPELACTAPPPSPLPAPETSACCAGDGTCKLETKEECAAKGFMPLGVSCSANFCGKCQQGPENNYKCPDGTLIKWPCRCVTTPTSYGDEEGRYCEVNPEKACPGSIGAAPLAITQILTRHLLWRDGKTSTNLIEHIFWTTNAPAVSYAEYGTTTSYGTATSPPPGPPATQHVAQGLPLEWNTTYHFRIIAEDDKGNKIVSDDYTFTTGL